MEVPYTPAAADAFVAAQTSVAAVLTAVVWHRPMRPIVASVTLVCAMWLSALTPVIPSFVAAVAKFPPDGNLDVLRAAAALATAAMLMSRPRWLAWVALLGEMVLAWLCTWIADSNNELAALHLIWFAALYAFHARATRDWERPREPVHREVSFAREDLVLFVLGVGLATLVAVFVLEHIPDSADEVGYNFQGLVYARFKAWAPEPPCPAPHRSHWIFYENGRALSMYLPGWPYFLAPFARLGVGWFASCVLEGALVVGVARVGRRVGGAIAGRIAAATTLFGACTLLNAGSQFPHVYVAALWVWSIEATCCATAVGISRRAQWGWGLVVGVTMGLCVATRPSDAALLGSGVFLVFVHALVRHKLSWRTFVATAVLFVGITLFTLVLLHHQYGKWLRSGYDIATQHYWWAKLVIDVPARDAWKYGLPLMTAAYCYFPAAAAVGVAGLIFSGRRIGFMLGLGTAAHLAFYVLCSFGRYRDFGYGPRYHLPLVVAMSVGAGALLGPLFVKLRGRRWWPADFVAEGPAVLAAVALVVGVIRIAPTLYPIAHDELHAKAALHRAIDREELTNAVVVVYEGATASGPLTEVQNDPFAKDPPVVILGPEDQACTRELYKDRKFYRAVGHDEIELQPF